jgi:DNA mismatch endonuclease (patch repair protein)
MARVRSQDTKPEMLVRRFLFKHGFRYRLHVKNLFGKPDIVMPKFKTVIFVHGCFWHGHDGCKLADLPTTRQEYWNPKISRNKQRDVYNYNQLKGAGWNVLYVYECELSKKKRENTLERLKNTLTTMV